MGTDPKHLKLTPTRENVLGAFAEGRTFAHRPLGVTDIARNIAEERDAWQDPFTVMSRTALVRLLDEMTEDGALVARTGTQWWSTDGVDWHDRRPAARYWTTRERAEGWARKRKEEAAQRREAQLQEAAEEHARRVLAERYPEDFASLVHAYRAEHGAAVEGARQ